MLSGPSSIRLWIAVIVLLGASVLLHSSWRGETIPLRKPLSALPYTLSAWKGQEQPLSIQMVEALHVNDYTNRIYQDQSGVPVQLYIGYYSSQRAGETIHSPKNCLPGSGWEPIRSGYLTIATADGRRVVVNEYVIQQDLDKRMVFYWYQSQGRVIASEYSAKFWLVTDAISRNRTDGALVRVITPIDDDETAARERLAQFTQLLFLSLRDILPD